MTILLRKLAVGFHANALERGETEGPSAASDQRVYPGKMATEATRAMKVDPVSEVPRV